MKQEHLYAIALTRIGGFNLPALMELYQEAGSATVVYEHRHNIRDILPDATPHLVEVLKNWDNILPFAERELQYDEQNNIEVLCLNDVNYPQRLRECPDAPLVLYKRGNVNLNKQHTLDIIGTRNCTQYGRDLIRVFIRELKSICPDALVFSGLAYGIDICAHRESLANNMETVGVVAHGLDMVYPRMHTGTAKEMCEKGGGIITEYTTNTQPMPKNFVQRNRIVAGCTDATLLVESANKGGGLITCSIARSYNREVFAFPGSIGAEYSEGCNHLIRDNVASLVTSAYDFVKAMNWDNDIKIEKAQKRGIERTLFPNLDNEEQTVVEALRQQNDQQINMLSVRTNFPMAGGCYHLLEV